MQKGILRSLIAALAASSLLFGSTALRAETDVERVAKMLKDTGFSYTTHNANTWSIETERKAIGKFRVIISAGNDILVTFAILAKKANINKTPKLMETLLTANHDYDYVKIGFDRDGDMFVRIDALMRTLDSGELKDIINQVANASGEVFAKVAGSVKK